MQVEWSGSLQWNQQYFKADRPMGVYTFGISKPAAAGWLATERTKLVAAWLSAQPGDRALPRSAVKAVEDHEK